MSGAHRQHAVRLDEGWAKMEEGVKKLKRLLEGEQADHFSPEEYMALYTTIYNMCTQKPPHDYSEQLYELYRECFNKYIGETVIPALSQHQNEYLLKELHKRWNNHKVMVRWLARFFNYLDRYYVVRHELHSLKDVGLLCFRDAVYEHVKKKAREAILILIEREREGEQIERANVKEILTIFIDVGMSKMDCYENDFEAALLSTTAEYYRRKSAAWVQDDSTPEYLVKAEKCIEEEEARVEHYLHKSSQEKLLKEVETELLANYESQLLEKEHSGVSALLRDDKSDDLARMYRLFIRIPKGLEPVADAFKRHVEGEGMKLVKEITEIAQAQKEKKKGGKDKDGGIPYEQVYVKSVIELHDKYLRYAEACFNNHSLFHKALKEAFESFCNKQVADSMSAELMATFCDNLLKKGGNEKLSDEAIEETLEKVVKLLAYISDKDLFGEYYRKKLARRLLSDKSSSDDHERSLLSRLKQQCGAQFTSKMEGMVNDLQLARDKQSGFEEWQRREQKKLAVDVSVTVLTTGFWPTYKFVDMRLPQELTEGISAFKEFYDSNNKHRKLAWIFSHGNCHLMAEYARKYELIMTTPQAGVLMLFNDAETLSYAEIKEKLNIGDEDALRYLHSLACARHKLLSKKTPSDGIKKDDVFMLNEKFSCKLKRIKITLPPLDEKKKVQEDVDKDRRYAIDAAVVRIMKSRKALAHQQLIMEVAQQLQKMFHPEIKLIKKRIEDLIGREYIERDKDNPQMFKYLA